MSLLGSLLGKVRCPRCGAYERHKRDLDADRSEESMADFRAKMPKSSLLGRPPGRHYACSRGALEFNERIAESFEKLAKQIGERGALQQFEQASSPDSYLMKAIAAVKGSKR